MGRRWIDRYDPSRTLTAEGSPLKAETGVRFPLGAPANSNTYDLCCAAPPTLLQLFSNTPSGHDGASRLVVFAQAVRFRSPQTASRHRQHLRSGLLDLAETWQSFAGCFIHVEPSIDLDHDGPDLWLLPIMLCRDQSAGERPVDQDRKPASRCRGDQFVAQAWGRIPAIRSDADVRPDRVPGRGRKGISKRVDRIASCAD